MVKQKDKIYLPAGVSGLIRYGEKEESKIKITPKNLIYFSIGIGILLIVIRFLLL
ncbi:MAG: preprotein translocase subunit Sec61beta [Candidatus Aenigmatarchaeota archaeon]